MVDFDDHPAAVLLDGQDLGVVQAVQKFSLVHGFPASVFSCVEEIKVILQFHLPPSIFPSPLSAIPIYLAELQSVLINHLHQQTGVVSDVGFADDVVR